MLRRRSLRFGPFPAFEAELEGRFLSAAPSPPDGGHATHWTPTQRIRGRDRVATWRHGDMALTLDSGSRQPHIWPCGMQDARYATSACRVRVFGNSSVADRGPMLFERAQGWKMLSVGPVHRNIRCRSQWCVATLATWRHQWEFAASEWRGLLTIPEGERIAFPLNAGLSGPHRDYMPVTA
jgi:hypothetical protein